MSSDPGEREQAERLFRAHYAALVRFARRRTRDEELAGDVVAATFLTAWRRRSAMPDDPAGQLAWLYGVARNEIGTHLRSRGRAAALLERLRGNAQTQSPFAELEVADEASSDLAEAFNSLSPSQREVLSLHVWEGLDATSAAKALGCSKNAYSVRLHRARTQLSQALSDAASVAELSNRDIAAVGPEGEDNVRGSIPKEVPDES